MSPRAIVARVFRCALLLLTLAVIASLLGFAAFGPVRAEMPHAEAEQKNREDYDRYSFLSQAVFFCKWPDKCFSATNDQFVLAILGSDSNPKLLDKRVLRVDSVNNRKIVVKRFETIEQVTPCQILFLTREVSLEHQLKAIDAYRGKPVLLIGESKDFTSQGGCVGLVGNSGKIDKEFNTGAIQAQSVVVDLRLQRAGRFVETATRKETGSATQPLSPVKKHSSDDSRSEKRPEAPVKPVPKKDKPDVSPPP